MPAVASTDDTIGAAGLAALLGLGARRVQQLAEAGVIPRAGRGRYPLQAAVRNYCEHIREVAAGRSGGGDGDGDQLSLVDERAKLARRQTELVELRLARERGELVNAEEIRRAFVQIVTAARNRLLGVPSAAKGRLPHLSVADIEELERLIEQALEEVAGDDTDDD